MRGPFFTNTLISQASQKQSQHASSSHILNTNNSASVVARTMMLRCFNVHNTLIVSTEAAKTDLLACIFHFPGQIASHHGCSLVSEQARMSNTQSLMELERKDWRVNAVRRRRPRADLQSDTYVLMEPGKSEEFVSEEELRVRLKSWLENWPGEELSPDLARFEDLDDAVNYLVKSVCELEIDGDVGSVQWYRVRLDDE